MDQLSFRMTGYVIMTRRQRSWLYRDEMTNELSGPTTYLHWPRNIIKLGSIKIMPCVEGDRSDCQPKASSIAQSRRSMSLYMAFPIILCLGNR